MTSSTKFVEGRNLPRIFPAERMALMVDGFIIELYSSLDLDLQYTAVFRSLTSEQFRYLQEIQKKHLQYLLSPLVDDVAWRQAAHMLGQEHARHGITVEWVFESYRLFARHMTAQVDAARVPGEERSEFCSGLIDRLFRDVSMQTTAFSAAYSKGLQTALDENARANALYLALMSTAELVIRAQSEGELLDELCRLLVESELFSQVWIARPNLAGGLEIQSIFSTINLKRPQYLPNVYTGDEDRILSVRAWRHSKLQYTNDRLVGPDYPPIQNFCREHGLRATAVVPLFRDGDIWALLTLLSPESNIFNPELLELVERIGRLIGHGLDSLDLRQILDEERQHQSWLARHDTLTNVLNRRGVIERVEEAISRTKRHKKLLAVAVMDLNGFKSVNDLHGHPAGDLLLRTIADRLQTTLRQTDAVGRLGSDEFVLILEDLDQENDLTMMLSRVQAAVEVPIYLSSGRFIAPRSSMGVTVFPQDDSAPERLLRHAAVS